MFDIPSYLVEHHHCLSSTVLPFDYFLSQRLYRSVSKKATCCRYTMTYDSSSDWRDQISVLSCKTYLDRWRYCPLSNNKRCRLVRCCICSSQHCCQSTSVAGRVTGCRMVVFPSGRKVAKVS